jgi:starch phosphorylase
MSEPTPPMGGKPVIGTDTIAIDQPLVNRLVNWVGKDFITATDRDWFFATAYMTREKLVERWMRTMRSYYDNHNHSKRVYYLSMEFLMGRTLMNTLLNLKLDQEFRDILMQVGLDLDQVREIEHDAALGNGGLGRLAACFLDSMATLGLPGYGYGIRYEYGMFSQHIENGRQVEHPDNWLRYGNPWEFPRAEVLYRVHFHGRVVEYRDEDGKKRHHWVDTDDVMAMAYDTPIPGYDSGTVNNMRLWAAKASRDFDLKYFNEGDYIKAVEDKNESENLSKVLYPNDTTEMGRELRLKQQYFFVSASLQDLLNRHLKSSDSFATLPDKVAVQLNDTHPSIAIPEMMRLLVDVHHLDWDKAWDIASHVFSYTNHTLMPEALETWPVALFEDVLPRHMQIVYEINHRFLKDIAHHFPGDTDLLRRMSIIDETGERRVRMAYLAVVGSHKVNGVAELHTELMKQTIFADFHRMYPDRIVNMTNGITPRRWLNQANPLLSKLITSHIGDGWLKNLDELKKLIPLADDAEFQQQFAEVKQQNKQRFAAMVRQKLGIELNVDSLFDVQIKRIHEYKRQLLNLLHVITLYNRIRHNPQQDFVPRTVIFAGKAAPGYAMAKLIIRLINDVADVIDNDPAIGNRLKVVFVPNYDVTNAEHIIPACDLSQQISTAGTEASGTGNMKMALNGALTIGTLDGANVEIREEVGEDNIFIFGMTVEEVTDLRRRGYQPVDYYNGNAELREVIDMIGCGYFSPDDCQRYLPIVDKLLSQDYFMLLADYTSYIACQDAVSAAYLDRPQWLRHAILNVANMGKFSSDRTIMEYAKVIWKTHPIHQEKK